MKKEIVVGIFSGLLAAIVTLTGGYFLVHKPALEHYDAWENYMLLKSDIANKWNYSPDHPVFEQVEQYCSVALDAIKEGHYDDAHREIDKARDLLRPLPGPPVIEYPSTESLDQY